MGKKSKSRRKQQNSAAPAASVPADSPVVYQWIPLNDDIANSNPEEAVCLPQIEKIKTCRKALEDFDAYGFADFAITELKTKRTKVYDIKCDDDGNWCYRWLNLNDPDDLKFAKDKMFYYHVSQFSTPLNDDDFDDDAADPDDRGVVMVQESSESLARLARLMYTTPEEMTTKNPKEQQQQQGEQRRKTLGPRQIQGAPQNG